MSNEYQAYPLSWPAGWPRTQTPQRSNFAARTVHAALTELTDQLARLKATGMLISSNVTLGGSPKDKGVCVYFQFRGKPYALPCDRWDCVEDNLWALAKHIEGLRASERWGVGTIERVFAGFMALPPPAGSNPEEWWKVLRCERNATLAQAQEAYRLEASRQHPDRGGSNEAMATLNAAWAVAKRALSNP